MAPRTGTMDISTLIATNDQSAAQFGLDNIAAILAADLQAHNTIVRQAVTDLADITTDRQRLTGVSTAGEMVDVDEYGRSATQRAPLPSQVAFPLSMLQYAVGWTRRYLDRATPKDMALVTQGAQKAHLKGFMTRFKRALYPSANYTFVDSLVDGISFTARRLLNGDGSAIGDGPNGEVFDGSTHTHYLAYATLTTTAADALINTVVEHGFGQQVRIYINQADVAGWRGLTGFLSYVDPRIQLATNVNQATGRLDITRIDNRAIGIYGAAEVWVKPWAIPNYALCFSADAAAKPLVIREDRAGSMDLTIAAELDAFPLHAQYMESMYGIAVNSRANGAILFTGTGTTYTDPTI